MININIEKVSDLKNLNISHFKDDVFKLFDVSSAYDGPYFFGKITGYDNGDYTIWSSPTGYLRNNISPLFARNCNPIIVLMSSTLGFLGLATLLLKLMKKK